MHRCRCQDTWVGGVWHLTSKRGKRVCHHDHDETKIRRDKDKSTERERDKEGVRVSNMKERGGRT